MFKSLFARRSPQTPSVAEGTDDKSRPGEPESARGIATITPPDAEHVYLSGFGDFLVDGDGSSAQTPVQILATTSHQGVPQEYAHLQQRFGTMGKDWTVDIRSLGRNAAGRMIETFRLSLSNGAKIDFHFDVTRFYDR